MTERHSQYNKASRVIARVYEEPTAVDKRQSKPNAATSKVSPTSPRPKVAEIAKRVQAHPEFRESQYGGDHSIRALKRRGITFDAFTRLWNRARSLSELSRKLGDMNTSTLTDVGNELRRRGYDLREWGE